MSAVICYASVPAAGSSVVSGSLGKCNARGVDRSSVQNVKFNDPVNGPVEIGDGAFFSLANSLPQIVDDKFSVRSKVRIVESSDTPFGTKKFKDLQFFTPVDPESYEITVYGMANDTDAVVRNSSSIGEQVVNATGAAPEIR